jgi:hypothetical protein
MALGRSCFSLSQVRKSLLQQTHDQYRHGIHIRELAKQGFLLDLQAPKPCFSLEFFEALSLCGSAGLPGAPHCVLEPILSQHKVGPAIAAISYACCYVSTATSNGKTLVGIWSNLVEGIDIRTVRNRTVPDAPGYTHRSAIGSCGATNDGKRLCGSHRAKAKGCTWTYVS